MPVPSYRLKTKMMLRVKVALHTAQTDDDQHQGTNAYMQAMKAGEHKKGGSINTRMQCKPQLGIGMVVFIGL